jgi:protein SCO1/2
MALHSVKSAAVATTALFLLSVLISACNNAGKPVFLSTDITGANFGADFRLVDHSGTLRTLADFKGKAVVIFFGYTSCPDACPATMANIAAALQKLGGDAKRVQVLFVTIDPEHDTPELLEQYVSSFDPTFLGLLGNIETTKKIAGEFKAFYQKQVAEKPEQHSVDHSTGTYIYDTRGRLRLYVTNEKGPEVFTHDLAELLKSG